MKTPLISDATKSLQPLLDIADAQRHAFSRITDLQTEYFSTCFDSGMQQFKKLIDCADNPAAFSKSQLDFYRSTERQLADAAEKEYSEIHQATDKINKIIESNSKKTNFLTFR